jgi:hypothetical protein
MIKYILECKKQHKFESWFSNSNEYEKLKKRKLLKCIFCNSYSIKKSIMSPKVLNSSFKNNYEINSLKEIKKVKKELLKLRKYVEKNFKFVGDSFAKEVREIYYDKKNKKNIYGSTTKKEREELEGEGIDLNTIPWVDKEN